VPRLLPFVGADEVRAILARASEFLDAYAEATLDWDASTEDEKAALNDGLHASIIAVQFCAATASLLRDPSLLEPILCAAESMDDYDRALYDYEPIDDSVERLVGALGHVNEDVEIVAEHPLANLRAAAARGLDPDEEASLSLLRTLATDPDPAVRSAAKERLGPRGEVAWWQGKFAADPLTRMSDAEGKRHKTTLEKLSRAIDDPHLDMRHQGNEILALAATLPPVVALDVLETLAPRIGSATSAKFPAARRILVHADPPRLERILRAAYKQTRVHNFDRLIAAAVAGMKPRARHAACEHLLALALKRPEDGEEEQDMWSLEAKAAKIVAHAWPPERDPSPLLDIALARPDVSDGYDAVGDALLLVIETTGPLEAVRGRLVDARLTGFPGRWRRLRRTVSDALGKLPKRDRRRLAERALESTDDETVAWGIGELLGPLRDGRRDPARSAFVNTLWEEPRLRRAMSRHLAWACLPNLRADLRAGVLGFDEAAACLEAIGSYWGGVASILYYVDTTPDDPEQAASAAKAQLGKRKEHRDLLGSRAFHGRATDAELAAWSRVRDATPIERRTAERFFDVLPDGLAWRPDDRAYVERLLAFVRETRDLQFAPRLAICLAAKPTAEDVAFLDEMIEMERETDNPSQGRIAREARDYVRRVLGLESPPEPDDDAVRDDGAAGKKDESSDDWD
jgi:hypothetical protein